MKLRTILFSIFCLLGSMSSTFARGSMPSTSERGTFYYSWKLLTDSIVEKKGVKYHPLRVTLGSIVNNNYPKRQLWMLTLYTDPECKNRVYGTSHPCAGKRVTFKPGEVMYFDIPIKPLREYHVDQMGYDYREPVTIYAQITLFEENGQMLTKVKLPFNYENLYQRATIVDYIDWDYHSKEDPLTNHPTELTFSNPGYFLYVKYDKWGNTNFDPLENFKVYVSFWADIKRTKPMIFKESTAKMDDLNHPYILTFESPDPNVRAEEERDMKYKETNAIKRVRHNWQPFEVFVPTQLLLKGVHDCKSDTIFTYVDIYDMEGNLINQGNNYIFWPFSKPEEEEEGDCYHNYAKETETIVGKTVLNGFTIEKFNLHLDCECGYKEDVNGLERLIAGGNCPTEEADSTVVENLCPPHLWDYSQDHISTTIISKKLELLTFQVTRRCRKCGKEEVYHNVRLFVRNFDNDIRYEEEVISDELLPPSGCFQSRVKTINLYKYVDEVRSFVSQHKEVTRTSCPPHDFVYQRKYELNSNNVGRRFWHLSDMDYVYKCRCCGVEEIRSGNPESHVHDFVKIRQEESVDGPITAINIDGVNVDLKLVNNPKDSTMFYIAATEVTRELWAVVLPQNDKDWEVGDKYPAAGISYNQARTFIAALNKYSEQKEWGLRFRLPTVDEWLLAYKKGGNHADAWNGLTSLNILHPVAQSEKDKLGCYDMHGNVSEMCDSTFAQDSTLYVATLGIDVATSPLKLHPTLVQMKDLSEGDPYVGLRFVVDDYSTNAYNNDKNVTVEKKTSFNYYKKKHWNVYRCKDCGYEKNGPIHTRIK